VDYDSFVLLFSTVHTLYGSTQLQLPALWMQLHDSTQKGETRKLLLELFTHSATGSGIVLSTCYFVCMCVCVWIWFNIPLNNMFFCMNHT
jgi:hypothetical protein